ncbi:hypothetical protein NDU88_002322 [Pleurodeles waltl]|uniref:Uncharacterized protein n=1 Tax=Pleurodeles waltl TaxID=8319 RepID=A0AAV7NDA2_PLEWA|nr:hypothetical protein NDU88_002322 [Pleurodeles waltl]
MRVSGPRAGTLQDPVVYALVGPLSTSGSTARELPAVTVNFLCPMLRVSSLSVMLRAQVLSALSCSCQARPRPSHVPLTLSPEPRRRSDAPVGSCPALTFAAGPGCSRSSGWAPLCPSVRQRSSSARLGLSPSLRSLCVTVPHTSAR